MMFIQECIELVRCRFLLPFQLLLHLMAGSGGRAGDQAVGKASPSIEFFEGTTLSTNSVHDFFSYVYIFCFVFFI